MPQAKDSKVSKREKQRRGSETRVFVQPLPLYHWHSGTRPLPFPAAFRRCLRVLERAATVFYAFGSDSPIRGCLFPLFVLSLTRLLLLSVWPQTLSKMIISLTVETGREESEISTQIPMGV